MAAANDEVAERIRALGEKAPGSFASFDKLSSVKEEKGEPGWKDMIKNLSADQQRMVDAAVEAMNLAEEAGDQSTMDLMIERITQHQKNKWMLDATLE